jgi:hypothetical protein
VDVEIETVELEEEQETPTSSTVTEAQQTKLEITSTRITTAHLLPPPQARQTPIRPPTKITIQRVNKQVTPSLTAKTFKVNNARIKYLKLVPQAKGNALKNLDKVIPAKRRQSRSPAKSAHSINTKATGDRMFSSINKTKKRRILIDISNVLKSA